MRSLRQKHLINEEPDYGWILLFTWLLFGPQLVRNHSSYLAHSLLLILYIEIEGKGKPQSYYVIRKIVIYWAKFVRLHSKYKISQTNVF